MVKDQYTDASDGGKPVQDDSHAAACLAQGSNRSKSVPTSYGMKDRNDPGNKLTGRE